MAVAFLPSYALRALPRPSPRLPLSARPRRRLSLATATPSRPPHPTFPPPQSTAPAAAWPRRVWPRALLLLVAAFWGTNFPAVKYLQSGPHAVSLPLAAFSRFSLAAVSLLPFALSRPRPPAACVLATLPIGLALTAGYLTQSLALASIPANKAAFISSLAVVLVPLLQRLPALAPVHPPQPRPPLAALAPPLLAVLGVALLELASPVTPAVADAWAFVQALAFALGFIGNEIAAARFPHHLPFITFAQLAVVAVASAAWAVGDASVAAHALALPDFSPLFASPDMTACLVYAGVVTTALTIMLENIALVHVSAAEMAVLFSTEPFWAAAVSAVVLGEQIGRGGLVGGVVILIACLLNQCGERELAAVPSWLGGAARRTGDKGE